MSCYGLLPPPYLVFVDMVRLQWSHSPDATLKFTSRWWFLPWTVLYLHQFISIQLKRSKTDPFMKGVKLVVGKTPDDLCSVTALLSYLAVRGNAPGALFRRENLMLLSKSKFVDHVCQSLRSAGAMAHHFSGHSFQL